MIELIQTSHGLIGSVQAVNELAEKKFARILTVSDSHGNYSVFNQLVLNFGSECDALVFCGDGISDLAHLLEDMQQNSQLAQAVPPVIAFVQGNNDPARICIKNQIVLEAPEKQVLRVSKQNIFIAHGHRFGIDFGFENYALDVQLSECKIGLYGHTHVSGEVFYGENNEYKFINPGSCSLPRCGLPASCAILTVTPVFEDTAFIKINRGIYGKNEYNLFTPYIL